MKFSKVIGKIDKDMLVKVESKLSKVFLDLSMRYDNKTMMSKLGGDPLIFTLMMPVEHVCTTSIPTAATDGRRYYWNPKFVLKQSLIGLRMICAHEAWHAIYMHPQRRGSRLPKLWNIAVDYIVNDNVMADLKARGRDPKEVFNSNLGRYMTLNNYAEMLKDPFKPIAGFEDIDPIADSKAADTTPVDGDRELTDQEIKELEQREKPVKFYFADPDLADDMKRPEKIYEMLFKLLPKCPTCGTIGRYKIPEEHQHKKEECDCKDHCDDCCDGVDVFGIGGTLDDHMDTKESEEKLAKRISDAIETTRRMAGSVPGALEDELGKLTAPKVRWQDIIRAKLLKARLGGGRNDWTRFRTRPMFSGLLSPKRKSYSAIGGVLLDTSGSMSADDMAYGISQLQSLDERSELTVTSADATVYWDKSVKIKKVSAEELTKIKPIGRCGTMFCSYFIDYEKHIGKCDLLICITDGYLTEHEIVNMTNPTGVDVVWLITSECDFNPPFGRVLKIRD